ncbi:MAG TPA: hypothetical protein VMU09_02495, partial [Acidimicrobiales bacterium]|nr:hypothetical protein [Acidimicrobiales bacterium]
ATFVGAIVVFVTAVVRTDAVYGTRMAWFLGGAVPLLVSTAGCAWLASPKPLRARATSTAAAVGAGESVQTRTARRLLIVSLALLAIPVALVAVLLLVYGILFLAHSL